MVMKLKRLLLRYEPPGVGLECIDEAGEIEVRHKDLPFKEEVDGTDEVYNLVEGLLESEPEFLTRKKHQRALVQLLGRLYQMEVPLPEVGKKPSKDKKHKTPRGHDGSIGDGAADGKTPHGGRDDSVSSENTSGIQLGHRIVMAGLKNEQASLNGMTGIVVKVKDSGHKFEVEVEGDERHVVKVKGARHLLRVVDDFFGAGSSRTNALQTGAKVAICGLRNHAQLNGQFGRIIEFNEQMQRYEVRATDTGQLFRVKADNLVPILDEESAGDQVGAVASAEAGRPQRPPDAGSRGVRRPKEDSGGSVAGIGGGLGVVVGNGPSCPAPNVQTSSAHTVDPGTIGEGCIIELCGLKNAAWLNGEQAEVMSVDRDKGRYEIRLRMDGSVKKVKADNVQLVSRVHGGGAKQQSSPQYQQRGDGGFAGPPPPVKQAQQREALAGAAVGVTTEPYKPGTIIQLVGLRSAAALNGERGVVLKHDRDTDRYEIRLNTDGSTKKVRKDNIEPAY